jgi:phage terminase small subunit
VKQIGGEITHLEADPNRNDGKLRIKYSQVAPWASQMTKLAVLLLRIEQEFGLTPSSRSQVTLHGKQDDDPLATFVAKRSG